MTHDITRRTALKTLGVGLGTLGVVGGTASAHAGPHTLFTYDPTAGEFPENIAIDRRGRKYVSFTPLGEIRTISPDNQTQSTLATFDTGTGIGVIGVEVTPKGTLYACLITLNSAGSDTHGIWQIPRGEDPSLFAALDPETLPNDILLDGHSLLVTDSIGGAVLRVSEGSVSEWVSDPLLEGTGAVGFGFPIGANGIARGSDGTVYVANTEKGHIVAIPTNPDGSAGTPELFVADERLFASDGIAIDVHDNVYVGVIGQNTVVKVGHDRRIETLATAADGLDNPSDVTFGTSRGEQKTLFITNFALLSMQSPSLMTLDVGTPGRPIHP
ncbi:SMP-30/gluconolactonase/LRE family protein [Haloferax sp. S1W]|uniref:SMP-30/gluconolactonase/LRE family protein n=1 Tax=Haloferax sp. S1W TaxID=3377110 RepID=UPI0037C7D3A8